MKRALAALALLGLAACSSGGGSDEGSASPTTERASTTTTGESTPTTASVEEAKAEFLSDLEGRMSSDDPEFHELAYEFAASMCSSLDEAVEGPGADDAENDSAASDAAMSAELATSALDLVSSTGWEPEVNAVLLRTMADTLCPQHVDVVYEYTAGML